MRALEPWHLIVLVAVVALLFGSKRLPDAARGLGQSMRIFKAEVKEMRKEDVNRTPGTGGPTSSAAPPTHEPLEGRVVESDAARREGAPSERRNDA